MSSRLGRYWVQNLLTGYVAALLLLVALDGVFALLEELGRVGRGDYTTFSALSFVMWTLPGRVYEMTPLAALLGTLLWIGNLAARGELVAMAAAGVTRARMLAWTLLGSVVLVAAMVALGELVAPRADLHAQSLRAFAISERVTFGRQGLWARDDDRVVQVQAVMPGPVLLGVRVFDWDADEAALRSVTAIESARWMGDHWRSDGVAVTDLPKLGAASAALPPRNGTQTDSARADRPEDFERRGTSLDASDPGTRGLEVSGLERGALESVGREAADAASHVGADSGVVARRLAVKEDEALLPVDLIEVLRVDLRQMGWRDLTRYLRYLEANRLDADAAAIALWGRVFYPLSTLVLMALALAFVFGSQRDGGAGRRLFIGVVAGVVFAIVWRLSSYLGVVYGLPPVIAAAAPLILMTPVITALLVRSGRA
ncbi:MAG: LptF/LptG family permease [Thioalkalivibrionaceae bacterium]